MSDLPSPELLRQLLSYDPESGILRWRYRRPEFFKTARDCAAWNTRFNGKVAGAPDGRGYIMLRILGRLCLAHRVAWAVTHGHWPKNEIDHINGVRDDNRIANLRDVTSSENKRNMRLRPNNASGFNGVQWDEKRGKWRSRIFAEGSEKHLGRFETIEEAVAARKAAEVKYKFHPNHGRHK